MENIQQDQKKYKLSAQQKEAQMEVSDAIFISQYSQIQYDLQLLQLRDIQISKYEIEKIEKSQVTLQVSYLENPKNRFEEICNLVRKTGDYSSLIKFVSEMNIEEDKKSKVIKLIENQEKIAPILSQFKKISKRFNLDVQQLFTKFIDYDLDLNQIKKDLLETHYNQKFIAVKHELSKQEEIAMQKEMQRLKIISIYERQLERGIIDDLLQDYSEDDNYDQAEQILSSLAQSNNNPDMNYQDIDHYLEISNIYQIESYQIPQIYGLIKKFRENADTKNQIENAIKFCHGDQEQAIKLMTGSPIELEEVNKLDEIQLDVINTIGLKTQQRHREVYPKVLEKFQKLGYQQQDLDRVLQYIRDEAQIIIHFKLHEILKFFNQSGDEHCKNLFEVGKSNGNSNKFSRSNWEDNLFLKKYQQAKPIQRPKYGVFNIFNNVKGVSNCSDYGQSFMILKGVRLRTTFTYKDSSGLIGVKSIDEHLSTIQHYVIVLNHIPDQDLKNLVLASRGEFLKSGQYPTQQDHYKELQIHGMVYMKDHVEAIYYSKQELEKNSGLADLEKFKTIPEYKHIKLIPIEDK